MGVIHHHVALSSIHYVAILLRLIRNHAAETSDGTSWRGYLSYFDGSVALLHTVLLLQVYGLRVVLTTLVPFLANVSG